MTKISIITLGCKVNQYETDSLIYSLKKAGFDVNIGLSEASIYIINSCAVTNEAEHKSREQISKIIKINPTAKIYVCGCSSQFHPEKFLDKPNVCCVVGTENKLKLVESIINDHKGNLTEPISNKFLDTYKSEPTRTRSYLKIQDGCNNFCSYCIIPYTRGRERSRTLSSIKNEVKRLSKLTKEIVLVGINVASYGKDLAPKRSLVDVVNIFKDYKHLRLRFSSFEMGTITPELLDSLKELPNFCPFFHISLQSANNNVLKKMNRHYTISDYTTLINEIKRHFPSAGISTDIIAGFPTETDSDFEDGAKNIKAIGFSNIHIFPYSKREGTVASTYPQINGTIIKSRAKTLTNIANISKQNFLISQTNSTEEVLIEEIKRGFFTGFTKNYIRTYISPEYNLEPNKTYKVKLLSPYLDGMMAEVVSEVIYEWLYFLQNIK